MPLVHFKCRKKKRRYDKCVSKWYAGEFMTGKSLRPLLEGKDTPWREELFLENLYTGRDTPFQEGIRRGKWKYIRMYDCKADYDESDVDFSSREPDFEMLFDLESDPRELNNLIESIVPPISEHFCHQNAALA